MYKWGTIEQYLSIINKIESLLNWIIKLLVIKWRLYIINNRNWKRTYRKNKLINLRLRKSIS